MTIDKIGPRRGIPVVATNNPIDEASASQRADGTRQIETSEIARTDAGAALEQLGPIHGTAASRLEALAAATVAEATQPLQGLTVAERELIESVLADHLASDPMLLELLKRASGA